MGGPTDHYSGTATPWVLHKYREQPLSVYKPPAPSGSNYRYYGVQGLLVTGAVDQSWGPGRLSQERENGTLVLLS